MCVLICVDTHTSQHMCGCQRTTCRLAEMAVSFYHMDRTTEDRIQGSPSLLLLHIVFRELLGLLNHYNMETRVDTFYKRNDLR